MSLTNGRGSRVINRECELSLRLVCRGSENVVEIESDIYVLYFDGGIKVGELNAYISHRINSDLYAKQSLSYVVTDTRIQHMLGG